MIYSLIALSFLCSVAVGVVFRYKDRTEVRQIRKQSEQHHSDLQQIANERIRAIDDATIDFEMKVRQARGAVDEINSLIENNQAQIQILKDDSRIIEKVQTEIQRIANEATAVNEKVHLLEAGLDRVNRTRNSIDTLEKRSIDLSENLHQRGEEVRERLEEILNRIIEEAKDKTRDFVEKENSILRDLVNRHDTISKNLDQEIYQVDLLHERNNSLQNQFDEKLALENVKIEERFTDIERRFQERIHGMDAGLLQVRETAVKSMKDEIIRIRDELDGFKIEERFTQIEKRFQERIHSMDAGLLQVRETAVKSMKDEINHIRDELESFNLETIANRDEIINDTRRMATGLNEQIDGFQSKFLTADNRITKLIADGQTQIGQLIENTQLSIDQQSKDVRQNLLTYFNELTESWDKGYTDRTEKLRNFLDQIHSDIEELRNQKFEQTNTTLNSEYQSMIVGISEAGQAVRDRLTNHIEVLQKDFAQQISQEHSDLLTTRESFLRIKEELDDRIESLDDQIREVNRTSQKVDDLTQKARAEIIDTKDDLIHDLELRSSKFMEEQDQKLGKLNSTIDEKISRQLTLLVDQGQIQVEEIERRTSDTIRRSIEHMEKELMQARDQFAGIRAEVTNETEKGREIRDSILKELHEDQSRMRKFEEKLSLVDTAERFTLQLDEAITVLTEKMESARLERNEMEHFFAKLESLKDIRQKLEKEVSYLAERRSLLDGAEDRFGSLSGQIQELEARFATVEGADRIIERIEDRMLKFDEYRKTFEAFFKDLAERRKYFETTINTIEKSKSEAAQSATMAKEFLGQLERIDLRRDAAKNEVEDLEKRVASLQHLDREFQKVEARFEQMETLLTDLEQKQDQIATMSKKIGDITKQSDFMKTELESLLGEAGEKMDRLSAFYETVDQMVVDAERVSHSNDLLSKAKTTNDRKKSSGLEDYKKEGILSLYTNHKWDPDLIAERMKLDVAVVRSVIATHKQPTA